MKTKMVNRRHACRHHRGHLPPALQPCRSQSGKDEPTSHVRPRPPERTDIGRSKPFSVLSPTWPTQRTRVSPTEASKSSYFSMPAPRKSILSPTPSASRHWNASPGIRATNNAPASPSPVLAYGMPTPTTIPLPNLIRGGKKLDTDPSLTNLIKDKRNLPGKNNGNPYATSNGSSSPFPPATEACGCIETFARNFTHYHPWQKGNRHESMLAMGRSARRKGFSKEDLEKLTIPAHVSSRS